MRVGTRHSPHHLMDGVQKSQPTLRLEQRHRHRNAAAVTASARNEDLVTRIPMLSQPVLSRTKDTFRNGGAIIKRHAHDFDTFGQPGLERLGALQLRVEAVALEGFSAHDPGKSTNSQVVENVIHVERMYRTNAVLGLIADV